MKTDKKKHCNQDEALEVVGVNVNGEYHAYWVRYDYTGTLEEDLTDIRYNALIEIKNNVDWRDGYLALNDHVKVVRRLKKDELIKLYPEMFI